MHTGTFKPGDWVRIIEIPPNLADDEDMKTRTLFQMCVGKIFRVEDVEQTEGPLLLELHVGRMLGRENYTEVIWIEPEYVERAERIEPIAE